MVARRKFDQAFWASPIHPEAKMSQETRKIRFGLWYDFRNPAQWRQPADRLYREVLEQIAWGENNGFDDVWLSEHHFVEDGYLPSILPAAAAIAARTNRIRIASGVLLMPFHNPIRLAEDIATVDVISGGRFELGVGIGFKREEFSGFGVSSKERGARTDQSLEIIRRALSGETHPEARRPAGRQPFRPSSSETRSPRRCPPGSCANGHHLRGGSASRS
jgi:alkanesulfonate monooxygenase SsuD/methylene tetrahydromethanopterin reductase-like flavin-dependent oxidoreductase (luciferase family)